MVAYKGPVGDVLYQMVGGLKSAMGYCGTPDLEALRIAGAVRQDHAGELAGVAPARYYGYQGCAELLT